MFSRTYKKNTFLSFFIQHFLPNYYILFINVLYWFISSRPIKAFRLNFVFLAEGLKCKLEKTVQSFLWVLIVGFILTRKHLEQFVYVAKVNVFVLIWTWMQ